MTTTRPRPDISWRAVADTLTLRLVFLLAGWLGYWILVPDRIRPDLGVRIWARWDAFNFLRIAEVGYAPDVADGNAAAFFPGFPLAVRAVSALGVETVAAGLLVTTLATLVATHHLHKLAVLDGHDPERSVLALLLFPTAVFLVAPYSEAMFLAAAIPAFLFAKQGRPWAALPCVAIATATRSVGIFVVAGVAIELLMRTPRPWRLRSLGEVAAVGAAGVLPVVAFGLHLQRTKDDFFEFVRAQERGWGRRFADPFDSLASSIASFSADQTPDFLIAYRGEILFALLSVLLCVWLGRRREWGYLAFVGGTLAVAMTNAVYVSIPRFALTFFPFAFVIADFTSTSARQQRVFAVLGAVSMVGVVAFVNGRWFY